MFNWIRKPFHMILRDNAAEQMSDEQFIEREISRFKNSKRRRDMIHGLSYYSGKHEILKRQRTVIGENGELTVVKNLPNNRIVDNQYKKMVDQKNNYLLGQPIAIRTEDEQYAKYLKQIMDKRFMRLMKNVGEDALNMGLGWLYVFYNEQGEIDFKRHSANEIIPGWADSEHTRLDYAIRLYETIHYDTDSETIVEKVEVYEQNGISFFELDNGCLTAVPPYYQNYFTVSDGDEELGFNWTKIPLIPFKYNAKEIPLIKMVKSLQDGLNSIESNFQNQMEEDTRNTILVLVNYDGENLGEFRQNLATYGAVKVNTVDGAGGDLKTLQVEVNAANYEAILQLFKKAIIENAMGYDAKDDRLSGSPNQMNIQSMYSDIDLDANSMETEFQASFEELLWFINMHLYNAGLGDFEGEEVEVIFNRDILISEGEIIENIAKSVGVLSNETIIANHPWVDDPRAELERLAQQKEDELNQYGTAFITPKVNGDDDEQ